MYVAAMASAVGATATMALGGALTWAAVGVAVWRIPKLWSYRDGPEAVDDDEGGRAARLPASMSNHRARQLQAAESRGKSKLLGSPGTAASPDLD